MNVIKFENGVEEKVEEAVKLTASEMKALKGGAEIYLVGKKQVTRDEYKDHVQDVTGKPSRL